MKILSRAEKVIAAGIEKKWEPLKVMLDVMTVLRIEKNIDILLHSSTFNDIPEGSLSELFDDLDVILIKYNLPKSEDDEN